MSLQWMKRRAVARCAIAALLLGLALLAGLAVLSNQSAARTATTVAERQLVSQHWGSANLHIGDEYDVLTDYLQVESESNQMRLTAVIGSAAGDLRWLYAHGGSTDSPRAQALQNTYDGYSYTLRNLVSSDRTIYSAPVEADLAQAAKSATTLRKLAAENVTRNDREISEVLAASKTDGRRLLHAVEVIIAVDLVLVLACAFVLLTYQNSTERQAAENRYRASHDGLTGIANRELLTERSRRRSPSPTVPVRASASSCSTSTASRRSTTRSGTTPGTCCCRRSPAGCAASVRKDEPGRPARRRRVRRPAARCRLRRGPGRDR